MPRSISFIWWADSADALMGASASDQVIRWADSADALMGASASDH